MKRTPMLPRNPALPSAGPRTLVGSRLHRRLISSDNSVAATIHGRRARVSILSGQPWPTKHVRIACSAARSRSKRRACESPRARWSCTGLSARPGPRSAPSQRTPASVARPSTATSPTRRRCLMHAAPTGQPQTRRPTSPPGRAIESPDERLRVALAELYAFYRRTEPMLDNLFRDETTMPLVQERFAAFRGYFDDGARTRSWRGETSAAPPAAAHKPPSATRSPSPPGSPSSETTDLATSRPPRSSVRSWPPQRRRPPASAPRPSRNDLRPQLYGVHLA